MKLFDLSVAATTVLFVSVGHAAPVYAVLRGLAAPIESLQPRGTIKPIAMLAKGLNVGNGGNIADSGLSAFPSTLDPTASLRVGIKPSPQSAFGAYVRPQIHELNHAQRRQPLPFDLNKPASFIEQASDVDALASKPQVPAPLAVEPVASQAHRSTCSFGLQRLEADASHSGRKRKAPANERGPGAEAPATAQDQSLSEGRKRTGIVAKNFKWAAGAKPNSLEEAVQQRIAWENKGYRAKKSKSVANWDLTQDDRWTDAQVLEGVAKNKRDRKERWKLQREKELDIQLELLLKERANMPR